MALPRKVDIRRLRLRITQRLEDFPRQHEALQSAMEEFGPDFEAGSVHRAAVLIFESSREFIGPFRDWIEPYLTD